MRETRRKVLIVDDERMIIDTLALIFESNGYAVRKAYSAEQAVDLISEWSPSLAIIDVVLPVMDGIELATLLNARYPICKILLVSGDTQTTELMAEAVQKGCNYEILAKPVHPTIILERVADMLFADEIPRKDEPVASDGLLTTGVDPPPEG